MAGALQKPGSAPHGSRLPSFQSWTVVNINCFDIEVVDIHHMGVPGIGHSGAQRLADEICQASSNYGSAVRRCLDVGFKAQACAVEDKNFQHNFYSGIVALLEEDLNSL